MVLSPALSSFLPCLCWSVLRWVLKGTLCSPQSSLCLLSGTLPCKLLPPFPSLDSQHLLLNSRSLLAVWGFPSLYHHLESFSRQLDKGNHRLTLSAFHLSGTTVLHCLVSTVLKAIVSHILFLIVSSGRVSLLLITQSWLEVYLNHVTSGEREEGWRHHLTKFLMLSRYIIIIKQIIFKKYITDWGKRTGEMSLFFLLRQLWSILCFFFLTEWEIKEFLYCC